MYEPMVRTAGQSEFAFHPDPCAPTPGMSAMPARHGPPVLSHWVAATVLLLLDLAVWLGVPALTRRLPIFDLQAPLLRYCLPAAVLGVALTVEGGGYASSAIFSAGRQIRAVLAGGIAAMAIVGGAIVVFERTGDASIELAVAAALTLALLVAARLAAAAVIAGDTGQRFAPRTVLIGGGASAERLVARLYNGQTRAVRLLGFVDDQPPAGDRASDPIQFLGPVEHVFRLIRAGGVDQVILALPWSDEARAVRLLRQLADYPVHVRLAPDLLGYHLAGRPSSEIGGIALVHALDRPISGWSSLFKRAEDLLISGVMLAICLVPMLLIALAIRLDSPGPVLFRQRRVGFNDQPFEMLKFRSMRVEAAAPSGRLLQATRDDPRLTRVGRFLRRTSLDELPQLINVLRGEMAIVGPRPHAPGTRAGGRPFEQVVARYAARHRVKPGLTGLAQVHGLRGETRTEDTLIRRVEYDLAYIEHWSPWLDAVILARTACVVLGMTNAY